MLVGRSAVRAQQWWDYKIPPVLATALLVAGASRRGSGWIEVRNLVLFLTAAVGIAAFGHVVNDLADIRTDSLAGKRNVMSMMSAAPRVLLVGATLALGLAPFGWLPRDRWVVGLVAAEIALLVAYSVPPVRLKGRAVAGVLADASYAYLVPIALTIAVFGELGGAPAIRWWVVTPVLVWAMLMGVRGIVSHQLDDVDNDRRSNVDTLVLHVGVDRATRWASRLAVIELVAAALAIAVVAVAGDDAWLAAFAVAYAVWRTFQVWFLWDEPLLAAALHDPTARLRLVGFVLLNEFVERWLPLAALVAIAVDRAAWWLVVAAYLIAFDNALVEFISRDARTLPDALERLAHERRARRTIRRAAAARQATIAAGPAPVTQQERDGRRWVFVVCGPAMHLRTLQTAVANLRPLTSLEIWILTDRGRNETELDLAGVDRIVDVATPQELDDHQASIWLKTSVHRHLPDGEWCYLDSDVLAVGPGVEEVFEHRHGPVAFASDLTIAANEVDRFSPWAMNCGCAGHGDEHSCSHLRDELQRRLDLRVPGNWVHWNGGVFVFGPDSGTFLDLWHELAVRSFAWPEWRTRDQGALIATVWTLGCQELPRLPGRFNFIADLGNSDLCHDPDRGWALHPAGPWERPVFMHLYTSALDDPTWEFGRDVEAPIVRRSLVRRSRWDRSAKRSRRQQELVERWGLFRIRSAHLVRRLQPHRVLQGLRRRLGGAEPHADADADLTPADTIADSHNVEA
jgi:4-hydroxybenzoate polyprenyltransferase